MGRDLYSKHLGNETIFVLIIPSLACSSHQLYVCKGAVYVYRVSVLFLFVFVFIYDYSLLVSVSSVFCHVLACVFMFGSQPEHIPSLRLYFSVISGFLVDSL